MAPDVSIIIPTFRRPGRAVEAVRSALGQAGAFEVIVIDNDPAGSALEALGALDDPRLVVAHEPRAGVANARNAGLRRARAGLVAFLDDDEIASPNWLAELVRVQRTYDADIVFGPVRTRLPAGAADHAEFFADFFAREPGHGEGPIDLFYGCGCSLLRRAALPAAEPFSAARNETGGEDDLLFQTMEAAGARFAWAPGAWVWESPEPARVTLSYALKRAFAFGQGPATKAWTGPRRDAPAVLFWMSVGAVQTLAFGVAALCAFAARTPRRAFVYRRAVEGLGKLLWFPFIKPRFYGAARLARDTRAAA